MCPGFALPKTVEIIFRNRLPSFRMLNFESSTAYWNLEVWSISVA